MGIPFEAIVALRYMRARRKAGVSLTSVLTVFGVTLGVAALIVVTSVWNGFQAEFLEKLLGINAHALILRNHDVFRDHQEVAKRLRDDPNIEEVAPFVISEVIVQSDRGVQGVAIKGIDPDVARRTQLAKYAPEAAFDRLKRDPLAPDEPPGQARALRPGILIGNDLSEQLHVRPGDVLTVVSPYGGKKGEARTRIYEVAGIFHSGMFEFDSRMVFVHLAEAQDFFRLHKVVTGLEVWSRDPLTSEATIGRAIAQISPEDPLAFDVRDWSKTNRGLFGVVNSQKLLISLMLSFIVVVAAFNIMATLILLILEKGREIAVLKSLGATDGAIRTIFVLDGLIVGIVGCAVGVAVGLMLCAVLQEYGLKLDPRVYYLEHLPIVVHPIEVVSIVAGAMILATMATLFPATRAARMNPVAGLTRRTQRQHVAEST
ncbi:MAG: ABC transporter permease [Deltaproteobacteria bacterium]|nr:ABC transporter permease [Deltaproteobacteria bacterium]